MGSLKVGSPIVLFISFSTFIFSSQIINVFTSEADVINIGTLFLRIISLFIVLDFGRHILIGFFRGIKRTEIAMFVSMVHNFIFRLSAAYLLVFAFGLGTIGLWWSYPVTMFLGFALTYLIYLKIKKKITAKKVDVEEIILESEAEEQIMG